MGSVSDVFIHHFVSPEYDDLDPHLMQQLERTAMNAQPGVLSCMPYHRLVSGNGDVYEGRPWGYRGGATLNWNAKSMAFCFLGNFQNDEPNEAALRSVAKEMAWGLHAGHLEGVFATHPHRVVYPTACPGDHLVNFAHDGFGGIGAMARAYHDAGILGASDSREIGGDGTTGPVPDPLPQIDWVALEKYLRAVSAAQLIQQNENGTPAYTYSPQAAETFRLEVVVWQNAVNVSVKPHPALENDGKFGIATLARTIDFQRFFGLPDGGIVDDRTRSVMAYILGA
jgi:hypothetical protein